MTHGQQPHALPAPGCGMTHGQHPHALPAPCCAPGDVLLLLDFVDDRASTALLAAVLGSSSSSSSGDARASAAAALPTSPGWTRVAGRAVRSYGGTVVGASLLPAPLPAWAASLFDRLASEAGLAFGGEGGRSSPNHVLANAYPAGAGILPHTDGPAYEPVAAILSLGDDSPAVMRFYAAAAAAGPRDEAGPQEETTHPPQAGPPAFSVFLPPRSLLVFRGRAYTHHLHGLADGVEGDALDGSVLNAAAARAWVASADAAAAAATTATTVPRGPCRVSLTVRRVKKVRKGLLRL